MLAHASHAYPLETGGILLGYRSGDDTVVTDVIGPGPKAIHRRTRFTPDHQFHVLESARIFAASGGIAHYLGDWHTHPDGMAALSSLDLATLDAIATDEEARCPEPMMLIFAGRPGGWDAQVFKRAHDAGGDGVAHNIGLLVFPR